MSTTPPPDRRAERKAEIAKVTGITSETSCNAWGSAATGNAAPEKKRIGAWSDEAIWSAARLRMKKLAKKTPTATSASIVLTIVIATAGQLVTVRCMPKSDQLRRNIATIHQ